MLMFLVMCCLENVEGMVAMSSTSKTLVNKVESTYLARMSEAGLQLLVVPRVGMPCVAQLITDKKDYRVQVVAVMRNGRVEVKFVDFDNKDVEDHGQVPMRAFLTEMFA